MSSYSVPHRIPAAQSYDAAIDDMPDDEASVYSNASGSSNLMLGGGGGGMGEGGSFSVPASPGRNVKAILSPRKSKRLPPGGATARRSASRDSHRRTASLDPQMRNKGRGGGHHSQQHQHQQRPPASVDEDGVDALEGLGLTLNLPAGLSAQTNLDTVTGGPNKPPMSIGPVGLPPSMVSLLPRAVSPDSSSGGSHGGAAPPAPAGGGGTRPPRRLSKPRDRPWRNTGSAFRKRESGHSLDDGDAGSVASNRSDASGGSRRHRKRLSLPKAVYGMEDDGKEDGGGDDDDGGSLADDSSLGGGTPSRPTVKRIVPAVSADEDEGTATTTDAAPSQILSRMRSRSQRHVDPKEPSPTAGGGGSGSGRGNGRPAPLDALPSEPSERHLSQPPPPVNTPKGSRWGQFDTPGLREEAAEASAMAVASAAETAAMREVRSARSPEETGESVLVLPLGGAAEDGDGGGDGSGFDSTDEAVYDAVRCGGGSPGSSSLGSEGGGGGASAHGRVSNRYADPNRFEEPGASVGRGRGAVHPAAASRPPPPRGMLRSISQRINAAIGTSNPREEEPLAANGVGGGSHPVRGGPDTPTDSGHGRGADSDLSPHLSVRMNALRMLEMAEVADSQTLRRTRNAQRGAAGDSPPPAPPVFRSKREPAALAGLDMAGGGGGAVVGGMPRSPPGSGSSTPSEKLTGGRQDMLESYRSLDSAAGKDLLDPYGDAPSLGRNQHKDNRFSIDEDTEDRTSDDDDSDDGTGSDAAAGMSGLSIGFGTRRPSAREDVTGFAEISISNPDILIEEEDDDLPEDNVKVGLWSNRYSVDRHLMAITGGKNQRDLLEEMDSAHRRTENGQSATGMFRASPHAATTGPTFGGGGGSALGSWFRSAQERREDYEYGVIFKSFWDKSSGEKNQKKWRWEFPVGGGRKGGGTKNNVPPPTVWMDVNLAERSSLPHPPHHSQIKWGDGVRATIWRHKRRQICIGVVLAVGLLAAVGGLYGTTFGSKKRKAGIAASDGDPGRPVTFYVTSDVPYNDEDEVTLARQLSSLPPDAEFVVHLGDVSLAETSRCVPSVYEDVASVLKTSPATVFVIPGNNDWNDCPDPSAAWRSWEDNLGRFEENFDHGLNVDRQLERSENFAFVRGGVLFVGVNLVDGHVAPDQLEWDLRHQQNVQWTEMNLGAKSFSSLRMDNRDEFRAAVIFGHARPSSSLGDYFWPLVDDVRALGKPVLYVHASGGGEFDVYHPFEGAEQLVAVELERELARAPSPPVKVTVDFGGEPWLVDRRMGS